ncbi:MAG: prolipoprotein diacylglyceryl transferase [Anaerolineae bacterium]|jgi:phosphatidylglycerol:prolipoprotein diacylglycerol transferase|nr:prolipoprotein diacylglyceryl transferase [Anaerolineae bacterium]
MLFGVDGAWANILGWSVPSFPALIGLSALAAFAVSAWAARRHVTPGTVANVALVALAAAVIIGRIGYVAENWGYYGANPAEITDIGRGGLAWLWALVGGGLGVWLATFPLGPEARWALWSAAALAVPIVASGVWWACEANACAYGAEVANLADYSAFWVWEAPGEFGLVAPRWRVQRMGMLLAAGVLFIIGLMTWRGWFRRWHLPAALVMVAAAVLAVGGLRGDWS